MPGSFSLNLGPMPPTPSKTPLRVLYIEDNALVREITYELLAIDDRDVVAVATGEEALIAFQKSPFDIVVTDISLPAMSGFDLVRHVKKLAPAVPIILASGYPSRICAEARPSVERRALRITGSGVAAS